MLSSANYSTCTSALLQDLMQVDAFHCQLGKRNLSNDILVIQCTEANTGVEMHFLAPNLDLRLIN